MGLLVFEGAIYSYQGINCYCPWSFLRASFNFYPLPRSCPA